MKREEIKKVAHILSWYFHNDKGYDENTSFEDLTKEYLTTNSISPEAESDAVEFAEWVKENDFIKCEVFREGKWIKLWRLINEQNLTTKELYSIFKQQTAKCTCTGNTTNITPIECCPVHSNPPPNP